MLQALFMVLTHVCFSGFCALSVVLFADCFIPACLFVVFLTDRMMPLAWYLLNKCDLSFIWCLPTCTCVQPHATVLTKGLNIYTAGVCEKSFRSAMPTIFLQYCWIDVLADYEGVGYPPNGFLLQCSLFYESLVEPKPLKSASA